MLATCDVQYVGCSGCRLLRMWDIPEKGCSGGGMFVICDA